MGMYDTIVFPERGLTGQVKCWDCELFEYGAIDEVPDIHNESTYSIAMREGGYVNVHDSHIISWTPDAQERIIFDKYGDLFDPATTTGPLDEMAKRHGHMRGDPYRFGEIIVDFKQLIQHEVSGERSYDH